MAGPEHQELIIIKRYEEEEHEHHSSAWKVAHADFMTAMMAFFLIMWLINVTDKDVRKAIANYFNPVNLADSMTERKGLNDPEDIKDAGTSADGDQMSTLKDTVGENTGPGEDVQQGPREAALFQDPYAVLAEIIADAPPGTPTSPDTPLGVSSEPGTGSGDANRDPFDPVYWQMTSTRKAQATAPGTAGIGAPQGKRPDAGAVRDTPNPAVEDATGDPTGAPASDAAALTPEGGAAATISPTPPLKNESAKAGAKEVANAAAKAGDKAGDKGGATPPTGAATAAAAEQLEQQIKADLAAAMGTATGPQLDVRKTPDGTVISLTDDIDFSMFPIGSAVPDARIVAAMARIAQTLKDRPGDVVIRGYTDGRPFRSPNYDNWQLSAARANITHYMLVRGGLDERRIRQIVGFADRNLKNKVDPNAPENRRIEIVLQEPAR
ncbi:MotB family protein [Ancylobacter vacuolatus]|uniref:Chemotaxis protein MotB n=1 Tax=Ancylobacter vacuolatus TaxID=223389 RepID=A0ABU0DKJ3_9HYPH|nr:MotB family protein [Ancylobacter vacuolatus]MDQ0348953.1 chemotaxis protein MotB [Ancylobacter vacuolatus]